MPGGVYLTLTLYLSLHATSPHSYKFLLLRTGTPAVPNSYVAFHHSMTEC